MQLDDEYPCKSLNLICIINTCYDTIIEFVSKIITKHSAKLLDYSEARKRGKRDNKHGRNAQDSNENAQERLLELPRIDCRKR